MRAHVLLNVISELLEKCENVKLAEHFITFTQHLSLINIFFA